MILPVTAGGCLQRHPREIRINKREAFERVLLKKEKTPRTVFNDMFEANANPPSLFFFLFCEWNSALKNTIGIVVGA